MTDIILATVIGLVGFSLIGIIIWLLVRARKRRVEDSPEVLQEKMISELKQWGVLIIIATTLFGVMSWFTFGVFNFTSVLGTFAALAVVVYLFFTVKDPAPFAMYATILICIAIVDGLTFLLLPRAGMPPEQLILFPSSVIGRLIFTLYLFRQFGKYRKSQHAVIKQDFREDIGFDKYPGFGKDSGFSKEPDRKNLDQPGIETFLNVGKWLGFISIGLTPFAVLFFFTGSYYLFMMLFDVISNFAPISIGIGIASWLSGFPDRQKWTSGGITGGIAMIIAVMGFLGALATGPTGAASAPSGQGAQQTTGITRSILPQKPSVSQIVDLPEIVGEPNYPNFGMAIDASGDRMIAGTIPPGEHTNGRAYVFERHPDGSWQQVARLTPPPGEVVSGFGTLVKINGNIAAVGEKANLQTLYTFKETNGEWHNLEPLQFPVRGGTFDFEQDVLAVHLSAQPNSDSSEITGDSVFIYRLVNERWELEAELLETYYHGPGGKFGTGVRLDGEMLVVSAYQPSTEGTIGALYFYSHGADGEWTLINRYMIEGTGRSHSSLGSITFHGRMIAAKTANSDRVITLEDISEAGDWSEVRQSELKDTDIDVVVPAPNGPTTTAFGEAIAFDGNYLVVASSQRVTARQPVTPGYVFYVYQPDPASETGWQLVKILQMKPNTIPSPNAFWDIRLANDTLLIAAPIMALIRPEYMDTMDSIDGYVYAVDLDLD